MYGVCCCVTLMVSLQCALSSRPCHAHSFQIYSDFRCRCCHKLNAGIHKLMDQCVSMPTLQHVPEDTKAAGYRTWLGFYKGFAGKIGWSPEELVQQANYFSEVIGECGANSGCVGMDYFAGGRLHGKLLCRAVEAHELGVLLARPLSC